MKGLCAVGPKSKGMALIDYDIEAEFCIYKTHTMIIYAYISTHTHTTTVVYSFSVYVNCYITT